MEHVTQATDDAEEIQPSKHENINKALPEDEELPEDEDLPEDSALK